MFTYNLTFIFYGFLSILSQLIIFRELSIVFYGNELFIGTALSAWLFWVGAGSVLAKYFQKRINTIGLLFILAAVFLPIEILFIRIMKSFFYFGSFIGPIPMLVATFVSLSFYCLILGVIFPSACKLSSETQNNETALRKVYSLECMGSVLGGALFTYLLIGRVFVLHIAIILGLVCAFIGLLLLQKRKGKINWLVFLPILILFAALFSFGKLERISRQIEWKGYDLLKEEESRYAHLALAKMGSLNLFFENGLISSHFPDPAYYEEITHWPLLLSEQPKNILIAGNAASGILREVLKYNVERIDYLEQDEKIIGLLKAYLDEQDLRALSNSRVSIHNVDARFWIKSTGSLYDVVILNLPEPSNTEINRFFTREFYQELKSKLKSNGIIAFAVPSAAEYLKSDIQIFNASIYRTLKSVFGFVEFVPGDDLIFLASSSEIKLDEKLLTRRYEERGIANQYVVPGYFRHKLSLERRQYVLDKLESISPISINRDFNPVSYYYFSKLWLEKFSSPAYFLAVLIMLGILFWFLQKIYKHRCSFLNYRYYIFIFILGFIGMLVEMILILGFQALYGYVWWQMGMLFAAFMLGLLLGAILTRTAQSNRRSLNLLVVILIIFTLTLFMLLPLLKSLPNIYLLGAFPALLIIVGFILGRGFPLSGYMALGNNSLEKVSSVLYASDLWGGSLSAFLSGLLIIPLLGLKGAIIFALVMQLLAWLVINKD